MHRSAATEQQYKRPRDGADDVAAAAVADRAAVSAKLMAAAQHRRLQALECSKLAGAMMPSATRSLQQCTTEALALVKADAARAVPLMDLHHKLHVRHH